MSADSEELILEERQFGIRDGELSELSSWVYIWLRRAEVPEVVYVGATALPPVVRAWLHLHHDDPHVGRVRAQRPDAMSGELTVYAFRIDPALDRQAVKDAILALLNEEKITSGDDGENGRVSKAAVDVVTRIHAHLGPVHDA